MAWKRGKQRRRGRPSKKIRGHAASIVRKLVYCKSCRECKGHGPYRYLVWREGEKTKWKYLGR